MAFTLAQLAKIETDATRKGIMLSILREAKVMEKLPFENVTALTNQALRIRTLGTGGASRKIGGTYTEATDADVEPVWESVYGFGGEIRFDKVFDMIKNAIVDPKVFQMQAKLRAMAYQWNNYFINGDHATDPDMFQGLKVRVAGMPARQSVAIGDSDPLDPTASVANGRLFIDKFEEAWHKCNDGNVSAIFMNEGIYMGFARVLRYISASGGYFLDITKDSFDREVLTFKGVPFVDMGLKADESTEIITDTEVGLDSGADATSVYFASYNVEDGIIGIQLNPLAAYDINGGSELETAPATAKRIDWWNGLAGFGKHGVTRLSNLKAASSWT